MSADTRRLAESHNGYRLIVQSYPRASLGAGELPVARARPLASTQRSITREELERGIAVDVLDVGTAAETLQDEPVVVAWVESGQPDLDFNAFEARPSAGAFYGVATARGGSTESDARIVLKRRVAV